MISSNLAYTILCMHIENLEKRYEKYRISSIPETKLYAMLTSKKQRDIIDNKIKEAVMSIIGKLSRGEITPMMLPEKCRTRSSYIYYLRYLKEAVYPSDPSEAEKLALEVRLSILVNPLIDDVFYFNKDYFTILLSSRRKTDVEQKEGSRFFDETVGTYAGRNSKKRTVSQ